MKPLILLFSVIFVSFFGGMAHANTDYVRTNMISYHCDPSTGIGTLRVVFGGGNTPLHHMDTRFYHINHAGRITLTNNDSRLSTGDIPSPGIEIPGCTMLNACTTTVPLSGPRTYSPVSGYQEKFTYGTTRLDECVHNYTYPDNFPDNSSRVTITGQSLNYWPLQSGHTGHEGRYQWSRWGITKAVRIKDRAGRSCITLNNTATARYASTVVTLTPSRNGGIPNNPVCIRTSCDPSVSNNTLRTTPLEASGARCTNGTVANFRSTTNTSGTTMYTWSCVREGVEPASCTAQYRPLCVPTATNGCCDETRLPSQCIYSIPHTQVSAGLLNGVLSTQRGPTPISITGTTLSTNTTTGACRAPINGVPRVVCDTNPEFIISTTLRGFTLPSDITQRTGSCRIVFDAPDVCRPRTDRFEIRATTPECDPTIADRTNPQYCPREITESQVCLRLSDTFGNPVYTYATNRIGRVLGQVVSNEYFSFHNTGTDTTRYQEGTFSVIDNRYCGPICTVVGAALCGEGCPDQGTSSCNPTPPPISPCDPSDPSRTDCPSSCVNTPGDPNGCGDEVTRRICTPSPQNNFCNPPIPTTIPGCESTTSDPMSCIERRKACTGYIEVENNGFWTPNGDEIMYDIPRRYRIVIRNDDPICRSGILSIRSVTATGGTLSGPVDWYSDGSFTMTISRREDDTPRTARGPSVIAVFTQPGGITYGLTERADDFDDTPLTITGRRMKGVRILGVSGGTTIGTFNLNNDGVIVEQTSSVVSTIRNAIIRNASILTRGISPDDSRPVNGILYREGDIAYSSISGLVFDTLILKGNLTIDSDIGSISGGVTTSGKGIIVLKRDNGTGGDIIIGDSVRYIHALVFAESTFRGRSIDANLPNPAVQLVLKGTLFSRNTIGGSAEQNNLYLAGGVRTTDRNAAFVQDLNNIRNSYGCEDGALICTLYRGYPDPFIIDYDASMIANPPPGFTDVQQ